MEVTKEETKQKIYQEIAKSLRPTKLSCRDRQFINSLLRAGHTTERLAERLIKLEDKILYSGVQFIPKEKPRKFRGGVHMPHKVYEFPAVFTSSLKKSFCDDLNSIEPIDPLTLMAEA